VAQLEVLSLDLPAGTKRNWKFSIMTDGLRAEMCIWNVKTKRYLYNVHVQLHVLNNTSMMTTREFVVAFENCGQRDKKVV
jgi:hypothetical protein